METLNQSTQHSKSISLPPLPLPASAHLPTPSSTHLLYGTGTLRISSNFLLGIYCSWWSADCIPHMFENSVIHIWLSAFPVHQFLSAKSFWLLPFFMVFVREWLLSPISPYFLPHTVSISSWTDCSLLHGTAVGNPWVYRRHQAYWSCSNFHIWHKHTILFWKCLPAFRASCFDKRRRYPNFCDDYSKIVKILLLQYFN